MLFGVPGGGGNLDLIEAAGRAGLPFVLTSTETGGAIAAIAQAEITGKPGACLTTLGPGAASVVNGVACAHLERAPIVVFTDCYASRDRERYSHQQLNQEMLFRTITNFSGTLAPQTAFDHLERAFEVLEEKPNGPVHLDCPSDFNVEFDPRLGGGIRVVTSDTLFSTETSTLNLRRSRKPVVIAGLGAREAGHAAALRDICERQAIPAMVTYKAKGVIPDNHKWFGGIFTNGAIEKPLLDESDLVVGVGLDDVEFLPRPRNFSRYMLYGPQAASVDDAISKLQTFERTEWRSDHVREVVDSQRRQIDIPADRMTAQRVIQTAAARLAHDCRVTVDAGAHMFPATMLWPVSEPNQMLISNGLSTMGFALPAAIGAALLDRDRPVVALTGDGGLLMCLGELLTAVRERLKIIVIIFSDESLSLIEIKQQARRLAPAGVALGAMDWPAIAKGFGAHGLVAADERALARAIDDALEISGPCLIEAKIDRSNYGATMKAIRG